ncbi:MAG TPA: hypothetical protein VGL55_05575 [Steroidobacteraceae bacterium]|jgi:hypothetical protein
MSAASDTPLGPHGPWNPGIYSQLPSSLRNLCTILRPENVSTSLAAINELQQLTGLAPTEIVAFRPERLLLHEVLIRVTADFSVPDGSRIEDLGINFREMTGLLLRGYLEPRMAEIAEAFAQVRRRLAQTIGTALSDLGSASMPAAVQSSRWPGPISRLARRWRDRDSREHGQGASVGQVPRHPDSVRLWGPAQINAFEQLAARSDDALESAAYRCLARVLAALFSTHGRPWGTAELIRSLATDMASNMHGGDVIGRLIEPMLKEAAEREGYKLLPRQERPIVINTKGPSASGKSTLRPLQRKLAGALGASWSDFALISPDIWRKQLLDYGSLGSAYKYAGTFTSEELQVVDQKLDRYMALKHQRGDMAHLLIDRFRFDSFAPDSDEAGSNLLTRFGRLVYLFFMITPPEMLVERAWNRGLEVGRYKAVDDTLAHSIEAYTGMPDIFFTWVRRTDKRIHFEFLDNSVRLGELPRTIAFGTNSTCNVLDVKGILDIDRYGRISVEALSPRALYPDRSLLAPEHNLSFLRRCVEGFSEVNFAQQGTARVYLRMERGRPVRVDRETLQAAVADPCTMAGIRALAPTALEGGVPAMGQPEYLSAASATTLREATLGEWGPP